MDYFHPTRGLFNYSIMILRFFLFTIVSRDLRINLNYNFSLLQMNTMAIIFQLITCCYSNDDSNKSKQALILAGNCTIKHLRCYLLEKAKNLTFESSMSLHIPLLRVFSVILSKLVLLGWDDDIERFFSSFQTEEEVLALLDLPLRIATWMVEVNILLIYHLKLIL
jgi:hypothetical protein